MAVTHGSTAVLKLHDGVGLRDVSSYVTDAGLNRMRDLAETTALGSTSKTYIAGLKDFDISLEGNYDVTVDGYLQLMFDNAAVAAFEYYPSGTASTNAKYTGNFLLDKFDTKTPVNDKGSISATVKVTGGLTRAIV